MLNSKYIVSQSKQIFENHFSIPAIPKSPDAFMTTDKQW